MKIHQLRIGKSYVGSKKLPYKPEDRKTIRQITDGKVYFLYRGFVHNADSHDFAAWAKMEVA